MPSGEPADVRDWDFEDTASFFSNRYVNSMGGPNGATTDLNRISHAIPTEWREVTVPFEFKDLPLSHRERDNIGTNALRSIGVNSLG